MEVTEEECEVWTDSDDSEPDPVTHCCELDDEPLDSNKNGGYLTAEYYQTFR